METAFPDPLTPCGKVSSRTGGPILKPVTHELDRTWQNGNDDDAKNEKSQIILHYRHVSEEVFPEDEEAYPKNTAECAVTYKIRVVHAPNAGNEWGKGADNRKKARKNDSFSPMFRVKLVRFFQVSAVQ